MNKSHRCSTLTCLALALFLPFGGPAQANGWGEARSQSDKIMSRAYELASKKDLEGACRLAKQAAHMLRPHQVKTPDNHHLVTGYISALFSYSILCFENEKYEDALAPVYEARAAAYGIDGSSGPPGEYERLLCKLENHAGLVLKALKRHAEAIDCFERSMRYAKSLADASKRYHPTRLYPLWGMNAVDMYMIRGEHARALTVCRSIIRFIETRLQPLAGVKGEPKEMLAFAKLGEARALSALGKHEPALKIAREALVLHLSALELSPDLKDGLLQDKGRDYREAISALEKAAKK